MPNFFFQGVKISRHLFWSTGQWSVLQNKLLDIFSPRYFDNRKFTHQNNGKKIVHKKTKMCHSTLHVVMFIVTGKRKLLENYRHDIIAPGIHKWTCCCTILCVMIFSDPKTNKSWKPIPRYDSNCYPYLTRRCANFCVMICVLAPIAIQNVQNHNAKYLE